MFPRSVAYTYDHMISVENFYWILSENLLRPTGLACWYFYPFGTRDHLVQWQYSQRLEPRQEHHVLFQFDQEPIYDLKDAYSAENLIPRWPWDNKLCRLLANSERSLIKKQLCNHHDMIDWYYFYHGFAALDWFGDARFVKIDETFQKPYCSYNHLTRHKRSYRMTLTAKLIEADLVQFGDISFHGDSYDMQEELDDPNSRLTNADKDTIDRYLTKWPLDKLRVDHQSITASASASFDYQDLALWQRSFFHVVNETVFYDEKLHLTEKIFKPIVSLRPFLLVAAPGNLAYLRDYGFQTFSQWIDESYDLEPNHSRRLDMITLELVKLCNIPMVELHKMYQDMRSVLLHNKKHFFGNFQKIIVNELVENFDTGIRLWNNGRVDGRELPLHLDLSQIKQILLGDYL